VSATFCIGIDSHNHELRYDGQTWTDHKQLVNPTAYPIKGLDCSSRTFCVAAAGPVYVLYFDGTSWSHRHRVASGTPAQAISCPSRRFCALVTISGYVYTYHDGPPTGPIPAA
jgi:hypothetical protein